MHMVFADAASDDFQSFRVTSLFEQFPQTVRDFSLQYLISVLRNPYKVILDVAHCVTSVSVL